MPCRRRLPNEIPRRLLFGRRNVDRRQRALTEVLTQSLRVQPVGLPALAGLARDERWRHHVTHQTLLLERPLHAETGRSRLVARTDVRPDLLLDVPHQAPDGL